MSGPGSFQGTYAAEKVIVTIGGVIVSGFADGDFITAKYDEDRNFKKVGADGEVARAKNASKSGTVEVVLSSASGANDELSALFGLTSVAGIDAVVPIGVADLSGTTVILATKAWLKTAPEFKRGKEIGENTWVIDCADLKMLLGGNS